jgi:hypothetical protein
VGAGVLVGVLVGELVGDLAGDVRQVTQPHPWTGHGSAALPATRSGGPAA